MSFLEEGHRGQRDVVCRGKVSDRLLKELRAMLCRYIGRNGSTEGLCWKSKEDPEAKELTCLFLDGLCVTSDKELLY